jgi:lipocalin-like protein
MRAEDLVGAWRELGRDFVNGDGGIKTDIPRTSQIMYTPDGFMGVVNTPAKRARVGEASNPMSLDGLSAAERAAAAEGVVAYTGRYELKGDVVQHTIYSALNPNLVGTTQLRRVTLQGDDLTLATLPDAKGNYFRIRWRRAALM